MTTAVFIGNIPYDVPEEELVALFRAAGPIIAHRLVVDLDSGKSKGYGFIQYATAEAAALAIVDFNGYELQGRPLRVVESVPGKRPLSPSASPQPDAKQPKLEAPVPRPAPTRTRAEIEAELRQAFAARDAAIRRIEQLTLDLLASGGTPVYTLDLDA